MEGKTKKPMHRGHNEGNIRQRTDGRWEVRLSAGIDYKTGKPKRTSTCCNTKQEAIAILQEQAHDIRVNGWRDPMSVTLGEWYEYWLVTYMKDKVKQSTYMSYRGYGNKHFCVLYKIRLKKLEGRILQEAAIYADKIAVDEETVRLRSHISQYRGILQLNEPVGRKLDFLIQEVNRECNTIGSKCNDLTVARDVVNMKAEVEKIREQVQNME